MDMKRKFITFIPVYILVLAVIFILTIGGSRAVTAFTETAPLEKRHTVIIDAGHGLPDGGATSCTGVLESTINLEIALRLEDLMHLLGLDTVMIRKNEESVYTQGNSIASKKVSDLKNRVKIVNETEDCVLLSIHQNHFTESKYNGAQVFYAPSAESRELATILQNCICNTININNSRQVKKGSGIYLLEHVDCPAILIECGFLSNPQEEFLLRSEDYQKKFCCVLAACFSSYLQSAD